MPGAGPAPARWLRAVLPLLLLPACASPIDVHQRLLPHLRSGDPAAALAVLEAARDDYGARDEVLYHLERGMLAHYAGRFEQSNRSFEAAKRLAELHYTRSVSLEASTWLANDNTRPYYGENFERALLHVFGAVNYQALGQRDEALVEIRQLDFFLRRLVDEAGQDNRYRDDPFSHYLAGIFFESDGEPDEARIAYHKALEAYASHAELYGARVPETLVRDAARLAQQQTGAEAETALGGHLFGQRLFGDGAARRGRVLVLHYNGRAPYKIDTFIDVAFFQGWPYVNKIDVEGEAEREVARASQIATSLFANDVVRVAFPSYRRVPRRIQRLDVQRVGGGRMRPTELVTDVGAIARLDLEDRIHRVRAKAIARAVVKYALGKAAEAAAREAGGDDYGELAGALVAVSSALVRTGSEVADKRAWFTVPDQIRIAVLDLEPGEHRLRLVCRDAQGEIVREEQRRVEVEAGGLAFVIARTVE